MLKNNISKTPLSRIRLFLIICFYFVGFLFVFPAIAVRLSYMIYPSIFLNNVEWQFIIYLISTIICFFIALPLLKKEININLSKLISSTIICIIIMLILNILFSFLMSYFNGPTTSNNQAGLVDNVFLNKGLYLATVIILAPILEEIVFRGAIFRTIRSNYGFMVSAFISSLLFGFLHVYSSIFTGDFNDLIFLFLYGLIAFAFAFMYEYNKSIYAPIFLHIIYNLVANLFIIF